MWSWRNNGHCAFIWALDITGILRCLILWWVLGIPWEHSDFECLDGHWAFHRSDQILNAKMDIPLSHSNFECSDGHWAFWRSIQISNALIGIRHLDEAFRLRMVRWALGAFRFQTLRWALGVAQEQSDFLCLDGHWAFNRSIQISNARRVLEILLEHSNF